MRVLLRAFWKRQEYHHKGKNHKITSSIVVAILIIVKKQTKNE
jgi:hypothetical protein